MFFPRISTKRAFCGKDLMGGWTSWASSVIHPAPCRARNQCLPVCMGGKDWGWWWWLNGWMGR